MAFSSKEMENARNFWKNLARKWKQLVGKNGEI